MSTTALILILFVTIFFVMYGLPFIKARRMQGAQSPDLGNILTDEQKTFTKLLIYFWTPNCGMCRSVTPVIDNLMLSRKDVLKVNAADHLELARQFKIMATPTLVLIQQGNIAKIIVGAKSEKTIRALLD